MYPLLHLRLVVLGSLLTLGCADVREEDRRHRAAEPTATALPDSVLPFPESLKDELMGVTVADPDSLRYRLVRREQFHLLERTAPASHLFLHLRVDSAARLEAVLERPASGRHNLSAASLPGDLGDLPVSRKKEIFFRALLPIIVFHNQIIAARRDRLQGLERSGVPDEESRRFLRDMCGYYRLGSGQGTLPALSDTLRALLERVDRIPPSLALAQAAIESGWGSSRFSREGNNLFGQRVWGEEAEGLVPGKGENPRFRLAVFPTIGASVRSYMRNLNTHPAYEDFRRLRRRMRDQGRELDSLALSGALHRYSTRGRAYTDDLRHFIRYNHLTRFDVPVRPFQETSL